MCVRGNDSTKHIWWGSGSVSGKKEIVGYFTVPVSNTSPVFKEWDAIHVFDLNIPVRHIKSSIFTQITLQILLYVSLYKSYGRILIFLRSPSRLFIMAY